jgi:probable HAF family extracellular repeat protein
MKYGKLISAMALLVALANPLWLAAQEHPTKHQKYTLIDLGTFGGPAGYYNSSGGNIILNNRGIDSGSADTSTSDPYYPNCFNPDCFVSHAFRWDSGVLTDLGALPGVNSSSGGGPNQRGWIAGASENGLIDPLTNFPELRAILWTDDQLIDLGTLGGYESLAGAVNDGGQVVGFATNTIPDSFSGFGTQVRTFIWTKGVMRDVGTLGGPDSLPFFNTAINNSGQVAGSSFTSSIANPVTGIPTTDPFLWKNGTMVDLGTLGGTIGDTADLHKGGQVIGQSNLAGDLTFHSFLWTKPGPMQDLGTLGGDTTTALRLNDAGDVVGRSDLPGSQTHDGFLWRKGTMTDLGTLPGDPCTRANWINEERQIVGNSSDCTNPFHAILWEDGGPAIDLNTLIPPNSSLQLVNAVDINERGEIAGLGLPAGCQPVDVDTCGHAFLLIPCGHGHADGKECEDNPGNSAPPTQRPTVMTPHSPVPNERVTPFRNPLLRGYRTDRGGA